MAEVVDFEAARWAKWKAYAAKRAQQNGTTVEHEVAEGLALRAWLRRQGYKRLTAPFSCEREHNP